VAGTSPSRRTGILRLLQHLRRRCSTRPRQLRARKVTNSQDADTTPNVSAIA
jgi:hypothetical protein